MSSSSLSRRASGRPQSCVFSRTFAERRPTNGQKRGIACAWVAGRPARQGMSSSSLARRTSDGRGRASSPPLFEPGAGRRTVGKRGTAHVCRSPGDVAVRRLPLSSVTGSTSQDVWAMDAARSRADGIVRTTRPGGYMGHTHARLPRGGGRAARAKDAWGSRNRRRRGEERAAAAPREKETSERATTSDRKEGPHAVARTLTEERPGKREKGREGGVAA